MKRLFMLFVGVCLLAAAVLAGCAGEEKNVGTKEKEDAPALVAEDFNPGNGNIFKTDKGYYYHSHSLGGFRYVDSATGNDLYLCNKPECRHDGNEFCVATNEKYSIDRVGMYGGRIFATAIEATETQFKFHLLSIALDGSVLNEEVTYLTMEKTGVLPAYHVDKTQIYIHRNVAMIPVWMIGADGTETTQFFGTAVVNLDTKEVTWLDEEPFSRDNIERTDITAHGDYFYYCRKEGKKTVLHRYNIKDGSDETHKLLVGFQGNYVVLNDESIVYTRSDNRVLCVYHRETGENEEKLPLEKLDAVYYQDGTYEEKTVVYEAFELKTDGENIYVKEPYGRRIRYDENYTVMETWDEAYVHVFNQELEESVSFNMAEVMDFVKEVRTENPEDYYPYYSRELYFGGDEVYSVLPNVNTNKEDYVYRCTKESFLTGNPQFELAYKREK